MPSSYPPGVTGNEWQIAGPEWEGEITVTHECGFTGKVEAWGDGTILAWQCPQCGQPAETDVSEEGPDG